jgi:DNA modification methylase
MSVAAGTSEYETFLTSKRPVVQDHGVDVPADALHPALFPFQRDLTRWALRKGRAALFADTGMGKTLMQLAWAEQVVRLTGNSPESPRVLILAPLAVARQTVAEGQRWGIDVRYARHAGQLPDRGIAITNYEMADNFDPSQLCGVVLDESSILKNFEGKTRTALIKQWSRTRWRLCCTATPAPNDVSELANHAEFLGVMKRLDMLATFFVHDLRRPTPDWRLKGHAKDAFYGWLASWAMSLKRPSDLGYFDVGYDLPPLEIVAEIVECDWTPPGQLFATRLKGVTERAHVRQMTVEARVQVAADLIAAEPAESWIAWVGLNAESDALAELVPDAVVVEGADSPDAKADALERFANGEIRVLITKPSIAGHGMNFQRCARMAFVGLGDSYEQYYQAIRRCWRFGQTRGVRAHIVLTEPEEPIYQNVLRKERDADTTARELVQHVAAFERAEIGRAESPQEALVEAEATGSGWRLLLGDSAERLGELEPESVDVAVFSPPFSTLYTYSATERDLGNCLSDEQFWQHFRFISLELRRVIKPGRNVCVHVSQIPSQKIKDGVIGLKDFRGATIEHFQAAGFVYHGEVCIDKDPQVQAIRTKSKGLLFTQLHKDASWLRPALADYILVFRAPGENAVPVLPDLSNDEWISWARPVWYGIDQWDTLQYSTARAEQDERHIAPLQLGVIERCIRLWSNPGETVLSPFAGIGSEGYQAVLQGRRFVGIELKPSYFSVAVENLRDAERKAHAPDLFSALDSLAPDEVAV